MVIAPNTHALIVCNDRPDIRPLRLSSRVSDYSKKRGLITVLQCRRAKSAGVYFRLCCFACRKIERGLSVNLLPNTATAYMRDTLWVQRPLAGRERPPCRRLPSLGFVVLVFHVLMFCSVVHAQGKWPIK